MNGDLKEYITIKLEEYKNLLIIKGRYEELKSQNKSNYTGIKFNNEFNNVQIREPYKFTCKVGDGNE